MPLSRLSPRSHKRGLTPRSKKSRSSGAEANESASRHLSLWKAIRLTREELDNWKVLSEHIEKLFHDLILPRENRVTNTLGTLTGSLIKQFDNPERNASERSLLGLWIVQNIDTLHHHPFAAESSRIELLEGFNRTLDNDDPIDSQLVRLLQRYRAGYVVSDNSSEDACSESSGTASTRQTPTRPEEDPEEQVFDFGWHAKTSPTANTQQENVQNAFNHSEKPDPDDESDYDAIDSTQLDETIAKSQKSLSVDRLFRQLAKVLHPDREQDEVIKAHKHLLMSQCLEARQKKDIDTLLQLYCEHVGDLPDDLTDTSHEELVLALELQLKLLQRELRHQRFGNALLTQIVERYNDASNRQIEAKVALHAKELDQQIRQHELTSERVNTRIGLKMALEQRRSIELDRMTIDEITGM